MRQQAGQQGAQAKGVLSAAGGSVSEGCLWGQQHSPWVLQAMVWEALQGADQASQGAHLRVLEVACWALPYHEACCNLEVLVPDLGQGQAQGQVQVLWQTQRAEVVLASAVASQALAAFPAQPFAGGQEEVAPWPASCRPLSELEAGAAGSG